MQLLPIGCITQQQSHDFQFLMCVIFHRIQKQDDQQPDRYCLKQQDKRSPILQQLHNLCRKQQHDDRHCDLCDDIQCHIYIIPVSRRMDMSTGISYVFQK